ncbi:antigen peptide transporter 2-like [Actinia tenebrosa]|uniref:Antigen peptide transporter 2-like n=1 Tax=Actinia tenebrosa TaxID=6105 RepID=A0A6P8IYF3_ACTTE|nr:antigen peptide transporter 2-like [Actinia tenebrosa]
MEYNNIGRAKEASKEEETGDQVNVIFYTLPKYRFTILMQVLLVLDLASSVTLWLCGGNTKYMEDHVTNFTIRDSVIDLAVLSFIRCGLLFFIYGFLENISLKQIDHPYESSLSTKKCIWHFIILFFSIGSLAFSITKGVLIYNVRSDSAHHLHSTYYALVISALCFCFLESVGAVLSFHAMRKLKIMRILLTPNDKENEEKPKKKVSLGRLATLTKPEFFILFVASLALLVSAGSQIAAPYFFGMVITAAMEPGMKKLNETILILLLIYIGGAIGSMIRAWLYTLAGQRIVARIRKQLFNAIIRQEVAFFDTNRTGELINRLSSDTQVIQNALTVNISMLLRYVIQILGSIVFMFTLSPKLTGVLISVVPIIGVGAQQYGKYVFYT